MNNAKSRRGILLFTIAVLAACGGDAGTGANDAGTAGDTDSAADTAAGPDSDLDGDTDSTDGDTDGGADADTDSDADVPVVNVYEPGELPLEVIQIPQGQDGAPRPVRITSPTEPGTYPVIFFFHGYLCVASWYDTIVSHLASHGFIVAFVQTIDRGIGLPIGTPNIPKETELAHDTLDWLKAKLDALVAATPDFDKVGFAGHSRGGKIAWNLVRNYPNELPQAIAGVDPVDGTGIPAGSDIMVITEPLTYDMPSLVIGTGLGSVVNVLIACAPEKDGHLHFWEFVPSPAWHIVAEDFGHMEMMDDGINCGSTCSSCKASQNGDRDTLRSQVGGDLVAFFRGILNEQAGYLDELLVTANTPAVITAENK